MLVATHADSMVQRVLLAMDYHRWGSPADVDEGINANARNVLSGENLGRFAVNLPTGHGGLTRVQVYQTPFGSKQQGQLTAIASANLGNASLPLMSQWTPSDAATQFNASLCAAGAVVKRPVRQARPVTGK